MATLVLVPGGWHSDWWFEPIARRLRWHGHEAYPLTLTGVGDRVHLLTASVNLDTRIRDVANVLEAERIEDAVLVGHNHGGMVITGVADRIPERVDALVYIDAFVPGDGEAAYDLASDDLAYVTLMEPTQTAALSSRYLSSTPRPRRTRSLHSSNRSGSPDPWMRSDAGATSTYRAGKKSPRSPPFTSGCARIVRGTCMTCRPDTTSWPKPPRTS